MPWCGTQSKTTLIAACALTFALCVTAARAQLPQPPATTADALRQMAAQAAVIFSGQVVALRRVDPANGSTGVIAIDFAVDDAVRGATPGTLYTLREWAGLAPGGDTPFVPGRRYLMLLHAPGPTGLSSPVGGPDGAIPIRGDSTPASPNTPDAAGLAAASLASAALAQSSSAPRSPARSNLRMASPAPELASISALPAAATASVDLRWIATRVLTPLAYAPDSAAPASYAPASTAITTAHPIVERASVALAPPSESQPASHLAPYSTVRTLLHAPNLQDRTQEDHAAR